MIRDEVDDRHKRELVTRDGSRRVLTAVSGCLSSSQASIIVSSILHPDGRGTHDVAMPSAEIETPTPELMLAFYRRLYPFKSIFKWLNHEHTPSRLFTHREISFTLQNDVYLRYHSFTTADEFKKQTCTLNPTRFEIGPVYTARVRVRLLPPLLNFSSSFSFSSLGTRRRCDRAHLLPSKESSCLILI
jgi:hypothetical protein